MPESHPSLKLYRNELPVLNDPIVWRVWCKMNRSFDGYTARVPNSEPVPKSVFDRDNRLCFSGEFKRGLDE